jgi:hypothetical protein
VKSRNTNHTRHGTSIRAVQFGVLALAVAVSGIFLIQTLHKQKPGSLAGTAQSVNADESPIGGGRVVDLGTAESEMPFPLFLSESPLANGSTLSQVWSEPDGPEVGLVYDDGKGNKVVVDLYAAYLEDPKGQYQSEIDLGIADERLTTILGQPALVLEPFTDVPKTNAAWVRFELNGVDVNLFSFQYSTKDLIDIAGSLKQVTAESNQ